MKFAWIDRLLKSGLTDKMDEFDARRVYILNAFILASAVILLVFLVANALNGISSHVILNICLLLVFSGIWLGVRGGFYPAMAAVFINVSCAFIFLASFISYQQGRYTGTEDINLPFIAVTALLLKGGQKNFQMVLIFVSIVTLKTIKHFSMGHSLDGEYSLLMVNTAMVCVGIFTFTRIFRYFLERANSLKQEYIRKLEATEKSLVEANNTKDKLFSIVSHDIRNPLNLFLSMLTLDQEINLSQEDFQKYKKDIRKKLESLSFSVDNTLQWSKSQLKGISTYPTHVSLPGLIRESIALYQPLANLKKVEIEYKDTTDGKKAFIDPNHFRVILRNLMDNALKFTPDGGRVTIQTNKQENRIHLIISDSGIGMSDEQIQSILAGNIQQSRHGTRGEAGTGIGLSLSTELLKSNHAMLSIESEEGLGTSFIMEMPTHQIAPAGSQITPSATQPQDG